MKGCLVEIKTGRKKCHSGEGKESQATGVLGLERHKWSWPSASWSVETLLKVRPGSWRALDVSHVSLSRERGVYWGSRNCWMLCLWDLIEPPHSHRKQLLLSTHCRWGDQGSEGLTDLPGDTQLGSRGGWIWTQPCLTPKHELSMPSQVIDLLLCEYGVSNRTQVDGKFRTMLCLGKRSAPTAGQWHLFLKI